MLTTDILLLASLLVFCVAWLWRSLGQRDNVLWIAAGAGLISGLLGVLQGRWQAALGLVVSIVFVVTQAVRRLRGSRPKTGIPIATGAGFLLLAGLTAVLLYSVPVFSLPDPDGPYPVGVRDFELTDHSRLGVLFAAPEEPRRIAVRVWYPAATTGGYETRPYASEAELENTFPAIAVDEMGMPSFFYSHVKHVNTHSFADAPALAKGSLPVVFFNHGLSGYASQNTVLMEHLASKGYVVFSITHPYDTAPLVFADGTLVRLPETEAVKRAEGVVPSKKVVDLFVEAGEKAQKGATYQDRLEGSIDLLRVHRMLDDSVLNESPRVWVDDTLFVEDALAGGQAPDTIADIVEHADLTRVGHLGMSFGGSTAAALGYEDPRAGAAVNLDGSDFHQVGYNVDIPVPFMMIYSDSTNAWGEVDSRRFGYNDFLYERFETAGLRDDIIRVQVSGSNHPGVTDTTLMTRGPLHTLLTGSLEGRRMLDILNQFVGGFFDTHLLGRDGGFPDAQLATFAGDVVPHDVSGIREWWLSMTLDERAAFEQTLAESRA